MSKETKTVWVTKYALTTGIISGEAVYSGLDTTLVKIEGGHLRIEKRFVHRDIGEAKSQAESMRIKKIASLRKQIAKLEHLKS